MKLSIIVPIFNTPKELLEHCISSIKDNIRNLGGAEILCINDGSTEPHIEQMLKDAEAADNRFKYIYKPNSGVSDSRNLGIDMARGEYVIFVDADDYLESNAFRYMLDTIEREKVDVVLFGFCYDNPKVDFHIIKQMFADDNKNKVILNLISDNQRKWKENYGIYLSTCWAKIYNREFLLQKKCSFSQDLSPHEDSFFILCVLNNTDKFFVDNHLVYHYVYYEGSAIHKFTNRLISVAINMMPMLEGFVDSNYPDNKSFNEAIIQRAYYYVRLTKEVYFTHPQNTKSFRELKCEMDDFLSNPKISKWLKQLKLSAAEDMIDFKNRLLLKLHLYWIFLITERRKNKKL